MDSYIEKQASFFFFFKEAIINSRENKSVYKKEEASREKRWAQL